MDRGVRHGGAGQSYPDSPEDGGGPIDPGDEMIDRASEILRAGGLVALPTETVYGLAADASSPVAVERIFRVKGRPPQHPLIVHVGEVADLPRWARTIPDDARRLAEALWPGPLTLVLPRHPSVPDVVTGGLDTVAVRVPSHPVARRILAAFGGGLAAPSANRFGRVSPTTAGDVIADLGPAVDLVIDGGACSIGVESTIVEVDPEGGHPDGSRVTVLRAGGVSTELLEATLGFEVTTTGIGPARAPGMLPSHYAPRTPLEIRTEAEALESVAAHTSSGKKVGLLSLDRMPGCGAEVAWDAGGDLDLLGRSLYRWLREADARSLDLLVAIPPPAEGLGSAVRDRLERAAHR